MRTTEDTVPELPGPYLAVPPFYVKAFPEYLRAAGYYTSNRAKTDYQFGDAVHDLGRPRATRRTGATAPTRRSRSSRCSTSRSRTRAGSFRRARRARASRSSPTRRGSRCRRTIPDTPRRARRARADVRQHRRHGRPGRRDPPAARGRRPGRQHHRVLLERSRRRRAARQALALRLRPARAADDSLAAASRCRSRRRVRSATSWSASSISRRRCSRSPASTFPRTCRDACWSGRRTGPAPAYVFARARSDGRRIRHDAVGARRAVPLHPQLLARAALRRAHHLPQPERDHAGVAQAAGRRASSPARRRCGCAPRVRPRSSTTCGAIRIRSRTSPPSRRIAPRSSGCARRSPSG